MLMPEPIDPARFRQVMGQVPTCVTVVTAMVEDEPRAMVIGSFVSVSLDPPLAGFFCTTMSGSWAQLRKADVVGVNVLGEDQIDVSNACMREPSERFDGLDWEIVDGAPRIADSAAWILLKLREIIEVGDHELALCDVVSMDMPDAPHTPVIFYGGQYRQLAPTED